MESLISVIIPVYNMEAFLARCLDSVLNNTYRDLEILCIDDGSTDRSPEILREYERRDSRIIVIAKENGGVSSARNAGLDRMTGEFVCFVDPDDYVHPQYFEFLLRALRESGEKVAMCGFQEVETEQDVSIAMFSFDPNEVKVLSVSALFKDHSSRSFCWGKLFLAESTEKLRFRDDLRYAEDAVFVAEVFERKESVNTACMPYPLYYYLQRGTSTTKTVGVSQRLLITKVLSEKLFAPNGRDEIYLDHVIKRGLNTRYLATHILPDREAAKECGEILKRCRKRIRRTKEYGTRKKVAILLMIRFPRLYWLHRIFGDPSMWKWEKAERKKRREERKRAEETASDK